MRVSTERVPAKFPQPATQILVSDRALLNSPLEFVPIGIYIPTFSGYSTNLGRFRNLHQTHSAFKRFVWTLIYKIFSYLFYLCIILSILFDNIKFNFNYALGAAGRWSSDDFCLNILKFHQNVHQDKIYQCKKFLVHAYGTSRSFLVSLYTVICNVLQISFWVLILLENLKLIIWITG